MSEQPARTIATATRTLSKQAADRRLLIIMAWIATLLMSKLPLVIARDLLGSDIPWIVPAWLITCALLFALTIVWQTLRPMRGYIAIMGIILLVTSVGDPWISQSSLWQRIFAGASPIVILFGERALIAVEALVVLAAVLLMGVKRRDAFLAIGKLNAPVQGLPVPGRKKPVSWFFFGVIMMALLGGMFYLFLASQNQAAQPNLEVIIPLLPLILACAALNAFGEEAMYRAAPLSMLLPFAGAAQALWMTSVWFGLGHYYGGIPSGPFGFIEAGLVGLLMGKAMLDTRGMGWSWLIHVVLDTIIYIFLAIGAFS
jgi:membrane protease YdiL (CAAX protease family)